MIKRIKLSFSILKINFIFSLLTSIAFSILFVLSFLLINFISVSNNNIIRNYYGDDTLYITYVNVNKGDIEKFKDFYIEADLNNKFTYKTISFEPRITYYNENFHTMTNTLASSGIILTEETACEYGLSLGDEIDLEYQNKSYKLIVSEILKNNDNLDAIYLSIDDVNDIDDYSAVRLYFETNDAKDPVKAIISNKHLNYIDSCGLFEILQIINIVRIILITCLIINNLVICYIIAKISNELLSEREEKIGMKRAIGYNIFDILLIYGFSILFIVLISSIIAILITIPLNLLMINSLNGAMEIAISSYFNIKIMLANILIIFVISIAFIFLCIKNMFRKKISEMLRRA